jgi:hypothetical protein
MLNCFIDIKGYESISEVMQRPFSNHTSSKLGGRVPVLGSGHATSLKGKNKSSKA